MEAGRLARPLPSPGNEYTALNNRLKTEKAELGALRSKANPLTKLKIVVGKLGPPDSPAEGQSRVRIEITHKSCSLQALLHLGHRFGDE